MRSWSITILILLMAGTQYLYAQVADLQAALDNAQPGDVIEFTGTHAGPILTKVHGTASQPITIRGIGTATILGSTTSSGYGLEVSHNYYRFENFTIRNFKKGIYIFDADHGIAKNIVIEDIGQEAYKVKRYSNYWLFEACIARNTGLSGNYGEGFYIGDADNNWESSTSPDTSGYVTLLNCIAEDTGNDGFDVKEGAHHVKMINTIARFPNRQPTLGASVGDSGYYLRGNNIQIINGKVQDLTNGTSAGFKIYQETSATDGNTYGDDVELKGIEGNNLTGYLLHLHKSSMNIPLYPDYIMTNVAGGLYKSSVVADPTPLSSFTEMTWSGEGGDTYAGTGGSGGNSQPTVSITAPQSGVSFTEGDNITITATASDSDGSIQQVAFYNNGNLLGTDTTSPYTYTISNASQGGYALSITATDDDNATATASVNISVIGSGGSGGDLEVAYEEGDGGSASNNSIKPYLNIVNNGTSSVPLSELTVRYWFTNDNPAPLNFVCDYAKIGKSHISGSFASVNRAGATNYLELSFSSSAGSISAGGETDIIKARVHKTDWSNFDETDDYSYDASKTSFTTFDKVTLYRNGALVWGVEPSSGARLAFQNTKKLIKVYPNPSIGQINVMLSKADVRRTVALLTLEGKQVFSKKIETETESISIPTEELTKGIYLLWVDDGSEVFQQKVLIQ
ncbi:cellulose binding domain-containing protein [Limibacter armeniacum]|uniref:cellulose binding domain-containing protein n=1 Tax=Limibacter armeniacum TaxID=466084 RepID=UPI002FE5034B